MWDELGCDIILTSWNDWSKSGVEVVTLKSSDLSKDYAAAKSIFEYYYKETAVKEGNSEWIKRLEAIVSTEEETIKKLIELVGYHPLCIKVLAKQMSYLNGMEMEPSDMLVELEEQGIVRHIDEEVQNRKDDEAMEYGDAYHHLECIFGAVRTLEILEDNEKEALRIMTLVPSETGISMSRFAEWSGMGRNGAILLQKLHNKGWLEYESNRKDLLADSKAKSKGVYCLPMVSSEVLYRQEGMESTVDNAKKYIYKCVHFYLNGKEYKLLKEIYRCVIKRLSESLTEEYTNFIYIYGQILLCVPENINDIETGKKYLWVALEKFEKLYVKKPVKLAEYYVVFGAQICAFDNIDKALCLLKKALKIYEDNNIKESLDVAEYYKVLGDINVMCGHYENGISNIKRAIDIIKKFSMESTDYIRYYTSLNIAYIMSSQTYKSIGMYEELIALMQKDKKVSSKERGNIYYELGIAYCYLYIDNKKDEDIQNGIRYMQEAFELLDSIKIKDDIDKSFIARICASLVEEYKYVGDYENALKYFKIGIGIAKDIYPECGKSIMDWYSRAVDLYQKIGDKDKENEYSMILHVVSEKWWGSSNGDNDILQFLKQKVRKST